VINLVWKRNESRSRPFIFWNRAEIIPWFGADDFKRFKLLQNRLVETVTPLPLRKKKGSSSLLRYLSVFLIAEIGELINEIPSLKRWKFELTIGNHVGIHEEIVDVLHFMLNLAIVLDYQEDDFNLASSLWSSRRAVGKKIWGINYTTNDGEDLIFLIFEKMISLVIGFLTGFTSSSSQTRLNFSLLWALFFLLCDILEVQLPLLSKMYVVKWNFNSLRALIRLRRYKSKQIFMSKKEQ